MTDWLLSGLELKSTLFHLGQYCGTWQASTAGHQRASFHLVLSGECWLHVPASAERDARGVHLAAGDAVFLLHDMPHCLSPDPRPPASGHESERIGAMSPLSSSPAPQAGGANGAFASGNPGVSIACGFFEFSSGLDDMLLSLLPEYIVARRDHPSLESARSIFDLIRAEAMLDPHRPSPLIARLTDLLFVYALRASGDGDEIAPCFWSLMRRPEFAPLVSAIVESPRPALDDRYDGELRAYVAGPFLQAIRRCFRAAPRAVRHPDSHETGRGDVARRSTHAGCGRARRLPVGVGICAGLQARDRGSAGCMATFASLT